MSKEIKVSIICNAYNHEKHIREALDSFIMQKTNFAYEILIHDDASTDGTADIIREYEKADPDIVKPIYQSVNQYSQKISPTVQHQIPRAQGKYLAFCEGDDYWTDPDKLQKQFDVMEKNPQIDMCAHAAQKIDANTGERKGIVSPIKTEGILKTEQVILGGGAYLATNSLFYRTEMYERKPEFMKVMHLDYFLQIWGSLKGGIWFIPDNMSVYRINTAGGWTHRMKGANARKIAHRKRVMKALGILNKETRYKYFWQITYMNLIALLKVIVLRAKCIIDR